jgi:hypothetical protein
MRLDRQLAAQATETAAKEARSDERHQLDLSQTRARLLRERFGRAAEQMGSGEPAVRLAGVSAMASLADEWEKQRQQCVDVLCAYLRLPVRQDDGKAEVRSTVVTVMTDTLIRRTVRIGQTRPRRAPHVPRRPSRRPQAIARPVRCGGFRWPVAESSSP